ncbi:hypothetical protein HUN58_14470 [Curtobacterium sp. Csp1]|uniref:hypothetical protein n=1 Tax=unclassified Curtobacterium TaxID=257496 RepID=UPI001597F38F|nr:MULTISPECIES: hypothetical protein [unclassified Curtobacterium]QKS13915.1 hypothetical protein HUN60_12905 [Curtobacterium sp. csp3]QKS20958.1 hypothetical protein HUN58_14470 [Curtobacterium sp. Csp1]
MIGHIAPEDLRTEDPRPTGPTLDTIDRAEAVVRKYAGEHTDEVLDALGLLDEVLS